MGTSNSSVSELLTLGGVDSPVQTEPQLEITVQLVPPESVPKSVVTEKKRPVETGTLFRTIWRWHFYAGVFVTPFLLTLAVTGGLYIFKSEIEYLCRSQLLAVKAESGPRTTYQSQVDAAQAKFPEFQVSNLTIPPSADQSTVIAMRKIDEVPAEGRRGPRNGVTVYVNPYTNAILGKLDRENDWLSPFFRTVLSIHRTLFVGTTGRVITELTTSWTIILIITGMYLWWPRNWKKSAGVWVPRFNKKSYTLLRDLHAIGGMYFMPIALTIAVTGMFYTYAVGQVVHDAAHYVMEDPEEKSAQERAKSSESREGSTQGGAVAKTENRDGQERRGRRSRNDGKADAQSNQPALAKGIPLDEVVRIAQKEYPGRIVMASIGRSRRGGGNANEIQVGAGNDFNATYGAMVNTTLSLDRKDGTILSQKHLSGGGHFWHGWTYPLHVGSIYGPATKVLWMLACFVLAAMPITGLWMWWERRPVGQFGLPRRQAVKFPKWLMAVVAGFCVVLPIAGASVLLVLLGEGVVWLARRLRRQPKVAIN